MATSNVAKRTELQVSTILPLEKTEVIEMDRATAAKLIQDLVHDLTHTGIKKEVFRTSDNTWLVFKVKT